MKSIAQAARHRKLTLISALQNNYLIQRLLGKFLILCFHP